MKKMVCIGLSLIFMMGVVACGADSSKKGDGTALSSTAAVSESADLQAENEALKAENEDFKRISEKFIIEREKLINEKSKLTDRLQEFQGYQSTNNKSDEKQKENTTVQEGDVTVQLTGKTESTDYLRRRFINYVFTVKNNAEKSIKGIQGTAVFKDLFGEEILKMKCDFVGNTIEPGAEITISDLSMECNEFMDDHMKLYNTALDDLQFEYQLTSIVFTDGTTKQ